MHTNRHFFGKFYVSSQRLTRRKLSVAALAVACALASPAMGDIIATWNGTIGSWDDPTAWSTNPTFPTNSGTSLFDVFINAGDVALHVNPIVQNVTLSNASISGPGTLTVNNLLTLSDNAVLSGSGTVTTTDLALSALGGAVSMTSARALVSTGAATWTGAFGVSLGNGNAYTNQGTFTVNTAGDASFAGGAFKNSGAFIKSSSDANTITSTFNNSGSVSVAAGVLSLSGGGTDTGSFSTSGAGILQFNGGTHNFNASASVSSANPLTFGGGAANFNSGSAYNVTSGTVISGAAVAFLSGSSPTSFGSALALSSGSLTLNALAAPSVASFNFSGGTFQGSDSFNVTSTMNWSGGILGGSGTLTTKDLAINLAASASFTSTRALVSTGAATWSSAGAFNISAAGANSYTNQGTFSINTTSGVNWTGGTFNNAGGLTKASADSNTISSIFNNSGSVSVAAGVLNLGGGGTHTGSFSTSDAGLVNFSGGIHNFNAGSAFTSGNFTFGGGTGNFNAGSAYHASGATTVSGATVNFLPNSGLSSLGTTLTMTGGTLNLNDGSAQTVATFNAGGGLFQGSDNLAVTGAMNWSAGTLAGGGALTTQDLAINQTANVAMSGTRAVVTTGTATWSTTGSFNVNLSGTNSFTNQGTFMVNTGGAGNWTGGTFNNQGVLTKTSSDSNNFTTVFNNTGSLIVSAGTMQLGTVPQIVNAGTVTTLTGGSWEIDDAGTLVVTGGPSMNITVNNANVTLSGPGSIFARINTVGTNNGSLHLLAGRSFTAAGAFTNNGTLELGGGTFGALTLANNANATLAGFGTVTPRPLNSGAVIADGGTLLFSDGINGNGLGTVQVNPAGTLDLSGGASGTSTGALVANGSAAGSLLLGNNNILVSSTYSNAQFGVGNAFNKHANVSSTGGKILANGDNTQTLSGDVSGGATATPAVAFGNVHVGDVLTHSFQINNAGATAGPAVLYALQTGVNGGNITDARLSGTGVASSNVGPAPYAGASSSLNILFTASSDGTLTGQSLHIANNFDNIAEQTLSITGAAFNLAVPVVGSTPLDFGNFHVGDAPASGHFTLANNAPSDGFSEMLDGAVTASSGAIAITGAVTLLAPGVIDTTSLGASMTSTATAGHITGSATLTLASDGGSTSGLGITPLAGVAISASANIFRLASATVPAAINLGSIHAGDPLPTAHFSLTNTAANDGFSEKLDASISAPAGAIAIGGGVNLLAAGATDSTGLAATLAATVTPGHFTGTATLNLISDGNGTSGLGQSALTPVPLTASVDVFRLAAPALAANALNLGNIHVGDPLPSATFTISNTAAADGFSESLDASVAGATGGVTLSGAVSQLAPGVNNLSSLVATLGSSATAGHFTGNATLNLASNGAGTSGLGQTSLAGLPISASADVYRLAAPGTIPTINLGNVHVGDAVSAHLLVSNLAPSDGFSESLTADFTAHTGIVSSTTGSIIVAPNSSDSAGLAVAVDTSTAGLGRSGTATLHFASDGAGSSGLGITQLNGSDQTVSVTANVFNFAAASLQKISGAATFTATSPTSATLDFGVLNPGDSLSSLLSVVNAATGNADTLAGSWTLAAPHFALLNFNSFDNIAAGGAQNGLQVGFTASSAGLFVDTATLHPLSQNNAPFSGALPDFTLTFEVAVNPLQAAWTGAAGNWSDPAQWSTHTVAPLNGSPTNAVYAVVISSGTVNLDVNPTIGSLFLLGGSLRGPGNLTLSGGTLLGSYQVTGSTTITDGTLIVGGATQSAAAISGSGSLQVNAGATITSDAVTLGGAWTINGTHIIRTNGLASGTSKVSALTLAGAADAWTGTLDLTNNKLIVETDPAAHAAAIAQLQNQIETGKTGAGGIFTSAALSSKFALAVLDNAVLNKGMFGGVPIDLNSVLVGAELLGDANADGHVDLVDLNTILNNLGQSTPAWTSGNFDGAATIDLTDLNDVLNNLGASNPSAFAVANDGGSAGVPLATPEPASLAVTGLGAIALLRRRRK